jgi:hypothetical protein
MTLAIVASFALLQAPVAGRYEMGERLKSLESQWLATKDQAKRAEAVKHVSSAVSAFFSMRTSEACRALDSARAALEGRQPSGVDAIALRPTKRVFAPGEAVTIRQFWAYETPDVALTVRIKDQTVRARPGETNTISIATRDLALGLAETVKKQGEFNEYDPCEHLMIVAEALPDAYRFFDRCMGEFPGLR